jgi:hypothetical protein
MAGSTRGPPSPALRSGKVKGIGNTTLPPLVRSASMPASSGRDQEGLSKVGGDWRVIPQRAKPSLRATLKLKSAEVKPWGELSVEYHLEGEGKKSDFVGLYNSEGQACGKRHPCLRCAPLLHSGGVGGARDGLGAPTVHHPKCRYVTLCECHYTTVLGV